MTERQLWIWLTVGFGPANKRKWEVLSGFEGVREFYNAVHEGTADITRAESERLKAISFEKVLQIENYCISKGIHIYGFSDDEFPQRFREIYNPPGIIFVKGDISDFDSRAIITVAGARRLNEYSERVCHPIIEKLCREGFNIVSGIQVGSDQLGTLTALSLGSKTYVILGGGLGYEYPKGSKDIVNAVAGNGAVISEYFPNHRPRSKDFHFRNRLLGAAGEAVFVVQASVRSGSLSIAEFGLNSGRDIFTLPPHDIQDGAYFGNVRLLRDGACPVFSASDIIDECKASCFDKLEYVKANDPMFSDTGKIKSSLENTLAAASKEPESAKENRVSKTDKQEKPQDLSALPKEPPKEAFEDKAKANSKTAEIKESKESENEDSPIKQEILRLLAKNSLTSDELLQVLDVDAIELSLELTELELDGEIKLVAGGRYTL